MKALAAWHFGEGAAYCPHCPGRCDDCPSRLNAPRTVEGSQVWDLVQRCGGQLRTVPRPDGPPIIIGYDMASVLALAAARGTPPAAVAEFLPDIEQALVAAMNTCEG